MVLGSAAGGGFPQWNCRCGVCQLAWAGDPRVKRRTQTSVAVSGDGRSWTLLNASPDLRIQIEMNPALHPTALRNSPIRSVILTGAEVDQTAGLLSLREQSPFTLYAVETTLRVLSANPMMAVLSSAAVKRQPVALGESFPLEGRLQAELFSVPGKPPLYLETEADQTFEDVNVGVDIRATDKRLLFVPGAAVVTDDLRARMADADVVLFDGTLYTDDEMIRSGTGRKTGRRMGHMPISGSDGSLRTLNGNSRRRFFVHINNTNPILVEDSPERAAVVAAGWQVAEDGMEFVL